MVRVMAIVEGQTEESFIDKVLGPAFNGRGVFLSPRLIGKPGHRGGIGDYQRGRTDILNTLKQDPAAYCTTMFDYYAMPDSWPGVSAARGKAVVEIPKIIEQAILDDISADLGHAFNPARFIPYVQMHEYEGLLFSEPRTLAEVIEPQSSRLAAAFRGIRNKFPSPEDIDDGPTTAPSKRIRHHSPSYEKVFHGTIAATRIGLATMRAECPHFNEWLTRLESLQRS